MKKTTTDTALALYLPFSIKADYQYGGTQAFKFGFVTVSPTDQVRNCPMDYGDWHEYNSLMFRAQASVDQNDGKAYGNSCQFYDAGNVDYNRAASMLAVLKAIRKADESFPIRPATFGQYVQLMCKALGVTRVVQDRNECRAHDETEHVFWRVNEIQWLIDSRIDEFMAKHKDSMTAERQSWLR